MGVFGNPIEKKLDKAFETAVKAYPGLEAAGRLMVDFQKFGNFGSVPKQGAPEAARRAQQFELMLKRSYFETHVPGPPKGVTTEMVSKGARDWLDTFRGYTTEKCMYTLERRRLLGKLDRIEGDVAKLGAPGNAAFGSMCRGIAEFKKEMRDFGEAYEQKAGKRSGFSERQPMKFILKAAESLDTIASAIGLNLPALPVSLAATGIKLTAKAADHAYSGIRDGIEKARAEDAITSDSKRNMTIFARLPSMRGMQ